MYRWICVLILVFSGSASCVQGHAQDRQKVYVVEVLSGDTVRLQGGKVLHYASVKAPPLQSRLPLVRQYGQQALEANKRLVEGKSVEVEWPLKLRNPKGELIGYVFTSENMFVNLDLVEKGLVKSYVQAPNLKYSEQFRDSEYKARRNRLGVWLEEAKDPYKQTRYLGEKSTKIYYLPNSPELEKIPKAHLKIFNSRVEAKADGYRACNTCKEDAEPEF